MPFLVPINGKGGGSRKIWAYYAQVPIFLHLCFHHSYPSQFVIHYYIIGSAHHFETDLSPYNTDMVDYSIVKDGPVGLLLHAVYIIKKTTSE